MSSHKQQRDKMYTVLNNMYRPKQTFKTTKKYVIMQSIKNKQEFQDQNAQIGIQYVQMPSWLNDATDQQLRDLQQL